MPSRLSRREFLKITAYTAGGFALLGAGAGCSQRGAVTLSESKFLLGTVINLTVVSENETVGQLVIQKTFVEIERLSKIFSRFDPASELSQLNQQGAIENPSAEMLEVMRQSLQWSRLTRGAFDVTVKPVLDLYEQAYELNTLPTDSAVEQALKLVGYQHIALNDSRISFAQKGMAITLDGIAKGFIIDQAVQILKLSGYTNVLVEVGGDLYASGKKENDDWQIGVKAPDLKGVITRFNLANQAAATSGDYQQAFTADRRLHHILDPRTGRSPLEISSATIIASSAMAADALATATLVLGSSEGLKIIESLNGVHAYFITKSGQVSHTKNFPL